jgi:hypothetical protein
MFGEVALKKELGESNVLKLRMREVSIAEDTLRNGDVITAKERLVAGSACGFSARSNGANNWFASRDIEGFGTYGAAGHFLYDR